MIEFLNNNGDLIAVSTILFLFLNTFLQKKHYLLSMIVITEQCMTYLLFYAFYSFPFILKLNLGLLYLAVFFFISMISSSFSKRAISKIYFGIGVYHLLLAMEPIAIGYLFGSNEKVTMYIHSINLLINVMANLAILLLVVFGGHISGSRRHYLLDDCFRRP